MVKLSTVNSYNAWFDFYIDNSGDLNFDYLVSFFTACVSS